MSLHSPPGTSQGQGGRHGDRPGPRPAPTRLLVAGLGAVVLVGLLWLTFGGGGSSSMSAPSTPASSAAARSVTDPSITVTSPPPPPAPSTVEQVVVARYLEFWRTYDDYSAGTGPFDPVEFKAVFGPLASGGEYEHLFNLFQTNRVQGLATRGARPPEEDLRPSVVVESDTEATVTDCAVNSAELYKVATGEAVAPANRDPERLVAVMRLQDGLWKVTSISGQGEPCER